MPGLSSIPRDEKLLDQLATVLARPKLISAEFVDQTTLKARYSYLPKTWRTWNNRPKDIFARNKPITYEETYQIAIQEGDQVSIKHVETNAAGLPHWTYVSPQNEVPGLVIKLFADATDKATTGTPVSGAPAGYSDGGSAYLEVSFGCGSHPRPPIRIHLSGICGLPMWERDFGKRGGIDVRVDDNNKILLAFAAQACFTSPKEPWYCDQGEGHSLIRHGIYDDGETFSHRVYCTKLFVVEILTEESENGAEVTHSITCINPEDSLSIDTNHSFVTPRFLHHRGANEPNVIALRERTVASRTSVGKTACMNRNYDFVTFQFVSESQTWQRQRVELIKGTDEEWDSCNEQSSSTFALEVYCAPKPGSVPLLAWLHLAVDAHFGPSHLCIGVKTSDSDETTLRYITFKDENTLLVLWKLPTKAFFISENGHEKTVLSIDQDVVMSKTSLMLSIHDSHIGDVAFKIQFNGLREHTGLAEHLDQTMIMNQSGEMGALIATKSGDEEYALSLGPPPVHGFELFYIPSPGCHFRCPLPFFDAPAHAASIPPHLKVKFIELPAPRSHTMTVDPQMVSFALSPQNCPIIGIVLHIHGGPHSSATPARLLDNPTVRLLVALGYMVVFPNYLGSAGPSVPYVEGLCGHVGTIDVEDCFLTLNQARKIMQCPEAIPMAVMGGSHGGFISCHMAAGAESVAGKLRIQYKCNLKAAVILNPVTDFYSSLMTSDIADWAILESIGHENRVGHDAQSFFTAERQETETRRLLQCMWEASPMHTVKDVDIPSLVILGMSDRRVPPHQGARWIEAIKACRDDLPCDVLCYPYVGHALKAPGEQGAWIDIEVVYNSVRWIDNHLQASK